jgi:hypothetical protein
MATVTQTVGVPVFSVEKRAISRFLASRGTSFCDIGNMLGHSEYQVKHALVYGSLGDSPEVYRQMLDDVLYRLLLKEVRDVSILRSLVTEAVSTT